MEQKFGWYLFTLLVIVDGLQALSLTSSVEEAGRHAACPGEEVIFICSVRRAILEWNSDYFQGFGDEIRYTSTNRDGDTISLRMFLAELISITNRNPPYADMTSTLRVVANDALNETVVNCTEYTDVHTGQGTRDSRTLYIAAPPSPPRNVIISEDKYCHDNSSIVTVVEWEHPENDDWAKINFTVTVTITSSVNETRAVLPRTAYITAANCAGESSIAFPIVADCGNPELPTNGTLLEQNSTMDNSMRVDCGELISPTNGTLVQYSSTLEGSVVAYYCNEGLVPSAVMTTVCVANGSWTPNPGDLDCREPNLIMFPGDADADAETANSTTDIVPTVIVVVVSSFS